jgi:(p)ppGpp synthase/HD superfamily hydrolase
MGIRYSDRLEAALVHAATLHQEQRRKGTDVPYITHLVSVAALVAEAGGDEDQVIAALLHDALEDQPERTGFEDLEGRYGARVAGIVRACSDAEARPKPPWRERKERYLEHLRTVSAEVLIVSCADKLHNARTIVADLRVLGDALWARFKGGREGTLWYYREVSRALGARGAPAGLLERLTRAVAEMEALAAAAASGPA